MELSSEIPSGLTLYPSPEEFSNPKKYLERLGNDQAFSEYGIIKVVYVSSFEF